MLEILQKELVNVKKDIINIEAQRTHRGGMHSWFREEDMFRLEGKIEILEKLIKIANKKQ